MRGYKLLMALQLNNSATAQSSTFLQKLIEICHLYLCQKKKKKVLKMTCRVNEFQ